MIFRRSRPGTIGAALFLCASLLATPAASACTRFVYHGANDEVITARSMDWKVDVGTNLWVFPRGMKRSGQAGPNSIQWTSKHGSVIASGYDISTTDGMNEAGLVANVLWLAESSYPEYDGKTPGLTLAAWAQYVLDNFASVREAVDTLASEPFTVVTDNVPGEQRPGHLASVLVGRQRRQRHHRIYRRQAGHPPQPRLPGDDQLADLRQAAGAERILEADRRHRDAARHEPGIGPLRARIST